MTYVIGLAGFVAAIIFLILLFIAIVKKKSKKKYLLGCVTSFIVFAIMVSLTPSSNEPVAENVDLEQSTELPTSATDESPTTLESTTENITEISTTEIPANEVATTANPEPIQTTGQKNALKSAQQYLAFSAFSYEGLIEQLEFEKYSREDAVYAADNCGADWNEQAAKSAESYLEFSAFSRDSLIEQLEYEGFTHDQAVYGAEANGY